MEDGIAWPVKIVSPGTYRFELEYATAGPQKSASLQLIAGGNRTKFSVSPFKNEDLPVRDLTPRKEVYPRAWASVSGQITLAAGTDTLRVMPLVPIEGELLVKSLRLMKD